MQFRFLAAIASFVFLVPIGISAQDASDVIQSRLACAQGLGQQAVARAQAFGAQMGIADVCVKALSWSANNGRLLDIYSGNSGQAGALLFVNSLTDNARSSTAPFHSTGSAQQMWSSGKLTPSLAFDAGFTRSFLDKTAAPSGSVDMAALKARTTACLNENQSLAVCADTGRIQGALAFQVSSAFSGSAPSAPPQSQGPDRAQTEAAVDQKFRIWSQSWSWDRYVPGSSRVTSIDCSGQCKASGEFTFNRLGSPHTIPFVAFIQSSDGGSVSLGQLCYNDTTSNTRDCTQ